MNAAVQALRPAENVSNENISSPTNQGRPISLRFTWGGGEARRWQGQIRLLDASGQAVSAWRDFHLMSIERDAPGSVLLDEPNNRLLIRSLRPSTYGSFQVDCLTQLADVENAQVQLQFQVANQPETLVERTVQLSQLFGEAWNAPLDQTGNGIWIERPKEDRLRFEVLSSKPQVVQAGSIVKFHLHGNHIGLKPSSDIAWRMSLRHSKHGADDGDQIWHDSGTTEVTAEGHLESIGPLELSAPTIPGVYELVGTLEFSKAGVLSFPTRDQLVRKFQIIVVPDPQNLTSLDRYVTQSEVSRSLTISPDQLNSGWPRLSEVPRLGVFPRLNPISFSSNASFPTAGSDTLQVTHDQDGPWLELGAGQWRTISISDLAPGLYGLDVQYRNPQHSRLAVTVLQADRWGNYQSLQTGGGVWSQQLPWHWQELTGAQTFSQQVWINHEAARQPIMLVFQNSGQYPVSLGRVVLDDGHSGDGYSGEKSGSGLLGSGHGNQQGVNGSLGRGRQIDLHLQTPLLATVFQSPKRTSSVQSPSLNDWSTFEIATERVCGLLSHQGSQAIWMPVFSQGGSLFPSDLYQTSLRYENSGFNTDLQYAGKLDVTELLLNKLDACDKSFVPVFDFSGTLELAEHRALTSGMNLSDDPSSGSEIGRYNPLDPILQQSIQDILIDFVQRYHAHRSLQGVAITLGDESQLLFQKESHGLSVSVTDRFLRDNGIQWDSQKLGLLSDSSFAAREAFVLGLHRDAWLRWRSQQMTMFFQTISNSVKKAVDDAEFPVTLVVDNWLNNPVVRPASLPNLRSRLNWEHEALRLGVDLASWSQQPQPFQLMYQWATQPADGIVANRISAFRFHQEAGWQAMNANQRNRAVFQDPFEALDLGNIPTPGGQQAGMQTLVSYCAPHSRTMLWSEILWHRDAKLLQRQSWGPGVSASAAEVEFQESFALLPQADFKSNYYDPNCSVTIRSATLQNRSYFYLVNAAPWTAVVHMDQDIAVAGLQSLSQAPDGTPIQWGQHEGQLQCSLPPHSLTVFECKQLPSFTNVKVDDDPTVSARLNEIRDALFRKLKLVGQPKPWPYLVNADFEDGSDGSLAGWTHSQSEQLKIEIDSTSAYSGKQSLHVDSQSNVTWLRSQPMSPVSTGRISVAAWLRSAPAKEGQDRYQKIRLSIDGETPYGEKYYRYAEVQIDGAEVDSWQPVAAHFDDIPEAGLVSFRVGLDMMGPGEFWVDAVHCFDRWFDATDQKVLSNRLGLLAYALESRENSFGAYRMLSDYWLNFLYAHFEDPVASATLDSSKSAEESGRPTRSKRRIFLR